MRQLVFLSIGKTAARTGVTKKEAKNILRKKKRSEATSGHVAARESEYRSDKNIKKSKESVRDSDTGGGHNAAKRR